MVQVRCPGEDVAVYLVIALPPLERGAVQLTSAEPSPRVAPTPVGAPGTVAGVTFTEEGDGGPAPNEFLAATENVYATPFVRPVTMHASAPDVAQVCLPGDEVTVYRVIALKP